MIKDPNSVAELAREKHEENWRFRTFLKMVSPQVGRRVDQLAGEFGRAAEAEMDCTACGACCRDNCIQLSSEEQARLAGHLHIPVELFAAQYVSPDEDGEPSLDARPCPFLDDKRCSVYQDRPEACRGYPYLGGNVSSRMVGIIERAAVCPIVFDMLENLKEAVGFRRLG